MRPSSSASSQAGFPYVRLRPCRARSASARSGSAFIKDIQRLGGATRDAAVAKQVLAGNIPNFLRRLIPVRFSWTPNGGKKIDVTICVTPDYLSVGRDSDFVRVPLGLPAAAGIAVQLGFMLPTTKMVDAIYAQAKVHLAPAPMKPTVKAQRLPKRRPQRRAASSAKPSPPAGKEATEKEKVAPAGRDVVDFKFR